MKLTLRDLLWLALLIASLTAWGIQHYQASEQVGKRFLYRGRQEGPSAQFLQRQAALKKFAAFTDQQLDDHLSALSQGSAQWHKPDYEPCLTEMARRGLADRLQKHYDALLACNKSQKSFWYNLELLTALRRAQRKPDPLSMQVSLVNPSRLGAAPSVPPVIQATITNVDVGKEPVMFTHGGDYRGGRLERWRIELTDERGRLVRECNFLSYMGGGIYSVGPLNYGQTERGSTELDMREYVSPPRSGKYFLQVVYHNDQCIAGESDISGLIVTRSQPIAVTIKGTDNSPLQGVQSGTQVAIAIIAASGIMLLVSLIGGTPGKATAPVDSDLEKANRHRRWTIPRRDRRWCGLLLLVAAGLWLDYQWQVHNIQAKPSGLDARWFVAFDHKK